MKKRVKIILWSVIVAVLLAGTGWLGWTWYDNNVDRSGWREKNGVTVYADFHGKPVTGWMELEGKRVQASRDSQTYTEEAMRIVSPEEGKVVISGGWSTGCTDMGDLSAVMPTAQPYACGAIGTGHGNDYRIADVNRACVNSAKAQVMMLSLLMKDDAAEARKVIDERRPVYSSIREYFETVDKITLDQDAVNTNEDGTITLTFSNPE